MEEANKVLTDTWTYLGNTDPYWSVLTNQTYSIKHSPLPDSAKQEFFESGFHDVEYMQRKLVQHGESFRNCTVLDFGCGVGRLTKSVISKGATTVFGFDISEPHLQIAREQARGAIYEQIIGPSHLIETIQSTVGRVDITYSLIVLQHNRPPLMCEYIKALLSITNRIALLHIPYYIPNYVPMRFPDKNAKVMEMHCIERRVVHDIAAKCGFVVAEEDESKDMCGGGIGNIVYVLKRVQ